MTLEKIPVLLEDEYDDDSLVYYNDDTFYYNKKVNRELLTDIENHEFQIYTAYYKFWNGWKSPKLFLIGRGIRSGKQIIKVEGFQPYCYEYDDDGEYKTYLGKPAEKVIFEGVEPSKVADYRKKFERPFLRKLRKVEKQFEKEEISEDEFNLLVEEIHEEANIPLEADIPYTRRFLLDTHQFWKPKEAIRPHISVVDVETDFPENPDKIISFAINDLKTGEVYFNSIHYDTYDNLIYDLYERVRKFDVITGWNVAFDQEKIEGEFQRHFNRPIKLNHYSSVIDLLPLVKKVIGHQIRGSWSLDNAGLQISKVGKLNPKNIYPREMEPEELMAYNSMDVIVPEIIDNQKGAIECHLRLAAMLNCSLEETLITAVVNDIAILEAYHRKGEVLNSRPPYRNKKKKKSGDYAYSAAKPDARVQEDAYEDVVGGDFSAAYPTTVEIINASCESKDPNGKYLAPNGTRFNDNKSTFVEELLRLLGERYKVKRSLKKLEKGSGKWLKWKRVDFGLKTQVAAFSHGIFGWANSRMKDEEVADAITSIPRTVIEEVKKHLDEIGHPWVYSHTDSVYFLAKGRDPQEIIDELNEFIKEHCEKQGWKGPLVLDCEGHYDLMWVHSAARNVVIEDKSKIDAYPDDPTAWSVTGMNFMRSETPEELANIEIELIRRKLKDYTQFELLDYLAQRLEKLPDVDTTKLGIIKPLNKPKDQYGRTLQDGSIGGVPYHIKALIEAEDDNSLDISLGEKYMVIPVLTNETTGVRVIRRVKKYMAYDLNEGLPDKYDIDFEIYLRSNLWGKISNLFGMEPLELEQNMRDRGLRLFSLAEKYVPLKQKKK